MIVTMGMGTDSGGGTTVFYLEETIAITVDSEVNISIDTDSDRIISIEED